jgi:aspartyl-tRNA(Asn)/glutamyl-tRNA(Gln) amidotransferase subunit A
MREHAPPQAFSGVRPPDNKQPPAGATAARVLKSRDPIDRPHTRRDMPKTAPKKTAATAETKAALERIARRDGALRSFVRVTPETALAEAALVDAKAAAGDISGFVRGLPIAVKDIIDMAGVVSGCGSLTQAEAPAAERDAPVVQRLRANGAIVVGKTHTVEFAFGGYGTNVTVGTPWNPWDLKVHRTPGGSSSGSGAAVGGGLVPAALGTDTGGSVRIPAALCGCVGLKTSVGRVGRARVAPLSKTLDSIGPLARDVTTAAHMLAAMQGHDADDPRTEGIKAADPFTDLERGVKGLRLGRVSEADLPGLSSESRADFEAAVRRLADLGAHIETVSIDGVVERGGNLCGQIIAAEAFAYWRQYADDPNSGLATPIRKRMLSGKAIAAGDYIGVLERQRRDIAAFRGTFDRLDALLLPTIPLPAIPIAEVDERVAIMAAYTRWVNYLDLCAIAVPTALSPAGLPLSLQIVVRHLDDALALRIARAFEAARGPFPAPKA